MLYRALRGLCLAVGLLTWANIAWGQPAPAPSSIAAPPAPPPLTFDELKRQAENGNADAEQKLGIAYYTGQFVKQDYVQSFAWALKAANRGNGEAGFNLAFMYLNGQGTAKNPAAAFQWYSKLANQGLPRAQYFLAQLYAKGIGTPRDFSQAFDWCQKSARQGDPMAETAMGNLYLTGDNVPKNPEFSFGWFTKAANHGVIEAQLALANAYLNGIGTEKDPAQAIAWYQRAALQGNNDAKVQLGIAYLKGTGTPADATKGLTYLLNASRQSGYACYWVAYCYYRGIFVTADPVLACAWGLRASAMTRNPALDKFMAALKPTLTSAQLRQAEKEVPDLQRILTSHIQPIDTTCTFSVGTSSVIPFVYSSGFILIPVQTQDKSAAFLLFDTGAANAFLSDSFARKMNMGGNTYVPATGAGGAPDLGIITEETDFELPGMIFRNARWSIVPNFNLDSQLGRPVVGVLGMDLIGSLVVRINFTDHTIELIHPVGFKAPTSGTCLPLGQREIGPMVLGTVVNEGVTATGAFVIDTGNNGSVSLSRAFQDLNPGLKLQKPVSSNASGAKDVPHSSTTTCSALALGDQSLPHPRIDLQEAAQGAQASTGGSIGNNVWERFDVIFDFPHQKLYLQKNARFSDPFSYTDSGLHVVASGANYDTLTVREIGPDTPVALAGFQTGDILVKVDELGSEPLRIDSLHSLLRTPGTYHFLVKRKDKTLPLKLELVDPLAAPDSTPKNGK